jgi:predicted Zn-dependent protease
MLLGVPAGAQLPTLGDTSDLTTNAERKLGERIARELYRDPDYIDDPVLVEYVQRHLAAAAGAARVRGELTGELDERFAWQVLLGKDRTINAFACRAAGSACTWAWSASPPTATSWPRCWRTN